MPGPAPSSGRPTASTVSTGTGDSGSSGRSANAAGCCACRRRASGASSISPEAAAIASPGMAAIATVNGIDGLRELQGQTFGPSEWREVTQEMINTFVELSGDDQWIHVDIERAKTESPFGTTVAHGNLTLCVVDGFRKQLIESTGFVLGVNYGW